MKGSVLNSREICIDALVGLGLTALEAEIYVYLLQHSPATGYKVAKGIGRSFTNTYKALVTLREKGATLIDHGSSQLVRAVPVEELLKHVRTTFEDREKRLLAGVRHLPRAPSDTRIYQLATVEQVYSRAKKMLREVEHSVLLELFPNPLAELRASVEQAAQGRVACAARVYEPTELDGVTTILSPFGADYKFHWLSVHVDGKQSLLALMTHDGKAVLEGIWTAHSMLSRALYDHANSDLHHYSFREVLYRAKTLEEARYEYARLAERFPVGGDLGFQELVNWVDEMSEEVPD